MRLNPFKTSSLICLFIALASLLLGAACQRSESNTNTNVAVNTNTAPANVNANLSTVSTSSIAAKEPEKYRATLVFAAETEKGEKTIGLPTLSAEVARNGADRRVSFKLNTAADWTCGEGVGCRFRNELDATTARIDPEQLFAFLPDHQHTHCSTIVAPDKRGKLAIRDGGRCCRLGLRRGRGKR